MGKMFAGDGGGKGGKGGKSKTALEKWLAREDVTKNEVTKDGRTFATRTQTDGTTVLREFGKNGKLISQKVTPGTAPLKPPTDTTNRPNQGANQQIGGYEKGDPGVPKGVTLSSGGFVDNGARRMPTDNDAVYKENLRRTRLMLSSRSGRASTDLSTRRTSIPTNFLRG